jgi:hypothetical protein
MSLRAALALSVLTTLSVCGDNDTTESIISSLGCEPTESTDGSTYPTDTKFNDTVLTRFKDSVKSSYVFGDTWSDFINQGGEIHTICDPNAIHDETDVMFQLNARYTLPPEVLIQVNAAYNRAAASYMAHELHHHEQARRQQLYISFFDTDEYLLSLDAAIVIELISEASAQVAATDYAFLEYVSGNKDPLTSLLHLLEIEIKVNGLEEMVDRALLDTLPHADKRMAQAYIAEIIEWDGNPYEITMGDIEKAEISRAQPWRTINRARARAFTSYFGNSLNEVRPEDAFNINYIERLIPNYRSLFSSIAQSEAALGLTVDHGDNPPSLLTSEHINLAAYTYVGDENYFDDLPDNFKNIGFLAKYFSYNPTYIAMAQDSRIGIDDYIQTGTPPIVALQKSFDPGSTPALKP